jgi:S-adenosylmethionine:tRNA ribosyltransferase-isomerase
VRTELLDYNLPKELIAQHPCSERDQSRLMVLDPQTQQMDHERFGSVQKYLKSGDVLVLNDTQVLPARLIGTRKRTGGRWEGLFLGHSTAGWQLLSKTRGHLQSGEEIELSPTGERLIFLDRLPTGGSVYRPVDPGLDPLLLLQRCGHVPLPPYIRAGVDEPEDRDRYQTVFAQVPGSVAAPTAGLHFTQALLASLKTSGIMIQYITLHVGVGTFAPIKVARLEDHPMHSEYFEITPRVADCLNTVRQSGGRVIAVGSTTVRTLESSVDDKGKIHPGTRCTDILIQPGHRFRAVDSLITNFHLPRSTLLAMVAAFGGLEFIRKAYQEAVNLKYRFYSYGDAMMLLRSADVE